MVQFTVVSSSAVGPTMRRRCRAGERKQGQRKQGEDAAEREEARKSSRRRRKRRGKRKKRKGTTKKSKGEVQESENARSRALFGLKRDLVVLHLVVTRSLPGFRWPARRV